MIGMWVGGTCEIPRRWNRLPLASPKPWHAFNFLSDISRRERLHVIDWDACVVQPSENPAMPFGHLLQNAGRQPPNMEAGTLVDCYKSVTNEATIFDLMMIFVIGIIVHDVVAISSSPTTFMIIIHEVAASPNMMVVVIIAVTIVIIPHGMMI
jgi:hypothetical protein